LANTSLDILHISPKVVYTFFNVHISSFPLTPALSPKGEGEKNPLPGERVRVSG